MKEAKQVYIILGIGVLILIALYMTTPTDSGLEAQGVTNFDSMELAGDLTVGDQTRLRGATEFGGRLSQSANVENMFPLPTLLMVVIDIDNQASPVVCAEIGDGEVWIVRRVFVHVLDDWDTGLDNDAEFHIGDGNEINGFIFLEDAELQVADSEGPGATASWQGYLQGFTVGDYLEDGFSFIYAPSGAAETIDCVFFGTGLASSVGDESADVMVYIIYTRLH